MHSSKSSSQREQALSHLQPLHPMPEWVHEQSLTTALLAGLVATMGGVLIWAGISAAVGMVVSLLAIGLGWLVGLSVSLGRGTQRSFQILAASLTVLGWLMANLYFLLDKMGQQQNLDLLSVLLRIHGGHLALLLAQTLTPFDLLFGVIAAYHAFKLATPLRNLA